MLIDINTDFYGEGLVKPRDVRVLTDATRSQVIAANFLNTNGQFDAQPTDFYTITYAYNASTGVGITEQFTVSISNGVPTLIGYSSPVGVTTGSGASTVLRGQVTSTYGGGGTSNTFAATGLTASSVVTATIKTSTNSVAVAKAVAGTNTLAITFTADPGAATTVQWIAVTPAA